MQKSPDAFRTISEVAESLDVPQHVLRFWESKFPQVRPMKRAGGRRYYRPDDVDLLRGIRTLLYGEGYTIKGVQKVLREAGNRQVADIGRAGTRPEGRPLLAARLAGQGEASAATTLPAGLGAIGQTEVRAAGAAHGTLVQTGRTALVQRPDPLLGPAGGGGEDDEDPDGDDDWDDEDVQPDEDGGYEDDDAAEDLGDDDDGDGEDEDGYDDDGDGEDPGDDEARGDGANRHTAPVPNHGWQRAQAPEALGGQSRNVTASGQPKGTPQAPAAFINAQTREALEAILNDLTSVRDLLALSGTKADAAE